jgi:hypothetical protein
MSTTITTRDDQVVAVRFWGGRGTGPVVQLEITEAEMPAWAATPVAEEGSTHFRPLAEWLAAQDATIRFDNAARRNQAARELENHRWAIQDGTSVSDTLRCAASDMRRRARECTRQLMRAA